MIAYIDVPDSEFFPDISHPSPAIKRLSDTFRHGIQGRQQSTLPRIFRSGVYLYGPYVEDHAIPVETCGCSARPYVTSTTNRARQKRLIASPLHQLGLCGGRGTSRRQNRRRRHRLYPLYFQTGVDTYRVDMASAACFITNSKGRLSASSLDVGFIGKRYQEESLQHMVVSTDEHRI